MKLTKTTLLTTTLLSVFLISQTAIADQAPEEVQVFNNLDNSVQYQKATLDQTPRVNYSIGDKDMEDKTEWVELFPDSER